MIHTEVSSLPFRKIYAIDFEYCGPDGEIPKIVCMVIEDLRSGEVSRYWCDDICEMRTPPFETGEDVALLGYYAPAEVQSMRDLILSEGPWSKAQRSAILDYCQQDVVALGPLLNAMLRHAPWSELQFNQALLRGRYMKAVGVMQHRGIPIDLGMLDKLNANWEEIKLNLIENVDAQYGVYVDGGFKEALFQSYLAREGISWPRLDSGRLALDRNTFSNMSKRYPTVQPLHELRKTLGEFKLNNLAVGRDGRNRTLLSPLAAKTGRNQPSTTKFIFGSAKWIRGLIKPTEGSALAYCDWSSQEIAIAAALSDDDLLWAAYESGDPYIAFAIQVGLVPPGQPRIRTKASVTAVSRWFWALIMA